MGTPWDWVVLKEKAAEAEILEGSCGRGGGLSEEPEGEVVVWGRAFVSFSQLLEVLHSASNGIIFTSAGGWLTFFSTWWALPFTLQISLCWQPPHLLMLLQWESCSIPGLLSWCPPNKQLTYLLTNPLAMGKTDGQQLWYNHTMEYYVAGERERERNFSVCIYGKLPNSYIYIYYI